MAIDVDSLLAVLEDPAPEECWVKAEPAKGDHIRVRRIGGLYYHHGIYVSDDEVISFAGDDDYNPVDWWDTEIQPRRLSSFARAVKSKFGSIRKRNGKAFVTSTIRSPLPGLVWATRTMTCCSIIVSTLPMLVSSASTEASRRRTSSWAMP